MEDGGEHWDVISLPALAEATEKILATNEHEYTRIGNENEEKLTTEQHGKARKKKEKNPQSEFPNPKSADALGRKEGEALCPQRFDKKALLRIKAKLGSYGFSALYQQNPIPAGGGAFQREWFRQVIDEAPKGLKWARGYDLAVSTKTSADYTASFRCAFDRSGNLYIADGFRKRIEYPEQRRFVIERMKAELDTRHGVEAALHGQALVQDLRREREIRFRPLKSVKVDGDKLTRALAWANLAEEGKVILVRGPWIADFLEEVCRFTGRNDRHDDQIDAVSLAVRLLSEKDKRLYGF
jgi:predicted phage terminase large subunit-like protein